MRSTTVSTSRSRRAGGCSKGTLRCFTAPAARSACRSTKCVASRKGAGAYEGWLCSSHTSPWRWCGAADCCTARGATSTCTRHSAMSSGRCADCSRPGSRPPPHWRTGPTSTSASTALSSEPPLAPGADGPGRAASVFCVTDAPRCPLCCGITSRRTGRQPGRSLDVRPAPVLASLSDKGLVHSRPCARLLRCVCGCVRVCVSRGPAPVPGWGPGPGRAPAGRLWRAPWLGPGAALWLRAASVPRRRTAGACSVPPAAQAAQSRRGAARHLRKAGPAPAGVGPTRFRRWAPRRTHGAALLGFRCQLCDRAASVACRLVVMQRAPRD